MKRKDRERIKVIYVVTRIAMDSACKQAILVSENMDREIYETLLVRGSCESNEVCMSRWIDERNIRNVHIPQMKREIRLISDFIAWLKMLWLFIKEKPDIVHTRTAKAGTIGRIAAKVAGVPVIIHTFDGHVFNGYFGKWKTRFILGVERMLARFTTRIIAISNSQKQELIEYLKISDPDKIKVIHIGFDFDNDLKPAENGSIRDEFNFSDDDLLVGYVGRLAPIKRLDRLIDAYELVAKKVPSAKFVIIGDGEQREEITEWVKEKNLHDRTYFLGVRQDMAKVYSALDVIALSSDNEGTPAVLIEALNYEIPVVATNVGGVPDVVADGENGLLCEDNGPKHLAENLITVLNNKDLRNRLGHRGRSDVRNRFSLETLLQKLSALYIGELSAKSVKLKDRLAEIRESR